MARPQVADGTDSLHADEEGRWKNIDIFSKTILLFKYQRLSYFTNAFMKYTCISLVIRTEQTNSSIITANAAPSFLKHNVTAAVNYTLYQRKGMSVQKLQPKYDCYLTDYSSYYL
jgi:hypothetical protein